MGPSSDLRSHRPDPNPQPAPRRRKKRWNRWRRRIAYEALEARRVLAAQLAFPMDATDLTLSLESGSFYLRDGMGDSVVTPVAQSSSIDITGTDGDDELTLDASILASGLTITFIGDGFDALTVSEDADFELRDGVLDVGSETYSLDGFEMVRLTGGSSANRLLLNGWTDGFSFDGSGGADTLEAAYQSGDLETLWSVTGVNEGTLQAGEFSNVENLDGADASDGDDVFRFEAGGSLSGTIDGRGGNDYVVGGDQDNTWNISSADEGDLGGSEFVSIENLVGGNRDDQFIFADGATISGQVRGGALDATGAEQKIDTTAAETLKNLTVAVDQLDFSAYTTAIVVDLDAPSVTGIGTVAEINSVVGGQATDQILGRKLYLDPQNSQFDATPQSVLWTLTGDDQGTVDDLAFQGFEELVGQADIRDLFVFESGSSLSGTIDGGSGGLDGFMVEGDGSAGSIDIAYNPTGNDVSGTVIVNAVTVRFAGMDRQSITLGDDQDRVIQGTIFDDEIYVRADPNTAGKIEIEFSELMIYDAIDGTSNNKLSVTNPSGSLTIEGLDGTDTIEVQSLDPLFSADLYLFGSQYSAANEALGLQPVVDDPFVDTVIFSGDVKTGNGYLEVYAEKIDVKDDVTIDTGTNDVFLRARLLGVAELENLSPLLYTNRAVSIDVGQRSVIKGNGIYLYSQSEDRTLSDTLGASQDLNNFVIGPLLGQLTDQLALPAKVLLKTSDAKVTVKQDAQIIAKGTVGIYANAVAESSGVISSSLVTIGYVQADAIADIQINKNVLISAVDSVVITANGSATADLSASTSQDTSAYPTPGGKQVAGSLAISNATVDSNVDVKKGARILAGKTANVWADGQLDSSAGADSGTFADATAALAFSLQFSNAEITTNVDGTIEARAEPGYTVKIEIDPTVTKSDQIGYVNYTDDTIYVGPHALVSGDSITYTNRRGNSIGFLVDGRSYVVVPDLNDPERIRLAENETLAAIGKYVDLIKDYAGVATANNEHVFEASDVDPSNDSIELNRNGAAVFNAVELGQAVVLEAVDSNGDPIDSFDDNGDPIIVGGLQLGGTYYVVADTAENNLQGDTRFADAQVIGLAESENEARAGVRISLGSVDLSSLGSGVNLRISSKHVLDSGFVTGVGVQSTLDASDSSVAGSGLSSENSKTSFLESVEGVATANAFDTIFSSFTKSYSDKAPKGANSKLSVSGALAFSYTDHVVTTDIGANATLQSNEDLEVVATINESYVITAHTDSEPQQTQTQKGTNSGTNAESSAPVAIGASIDVGIYNNSATATVADGAKLDALRATRVISDVSYPFLTRFDEFIPLSPGEFVDSVREEGYEFFTKYLDGTLGLKDSLFNSWATSSSSGTKAGIAGAINVLVFTNASNAIVESNAEINQNASWHDDSSNPHPNQADQQDDGLGEQTVSVEATNYMQTVNMTGIFSLPNFSKDPTRSYDKFTDRISLNPLGTDGKVGIGGAVYVNVLTNTTNAIVKNGAKIDSGGDGGFNIKAEEAMFVVNLTQSGAKADTFALGGSVAYTKQTSDTLAKLGESAIVTGRNVRVYAGDLVTQANWVGALALADAVGAGISVAVNEVDRETYAVIGDETITDSQISSPRTTSGIDVSEAVVVNAISDGNLWAFSIAGAAAFTTSGKSIPDDTPQQGQVNSDVSSSVTPAIAGAASGAVNIVKSVTQASIVDAGLLKAGDVTVSASETQFQFSLTGSAALAFSGSKAAGALTGEFSLNDIRAITDAFVVDTKIEADDVVVEAIRSGDLHAIAAGLALAAGKSAGTFSGSLSINLMTNSKDENGDPTNETRAYLDGVDLIVDSVLVDASDTMTITADGGGFTIALSSGVSVALGLGVAVNDIGSASRAYVKDSTINAAGDIGVTATMAPTIDSLSMAGSLAVSAGGIGTNFSLTGAGAGSGNYIDTTAEAYIKGSENGLEPAIVTTNGGKVYVVADDQSKIHSDAGAIGVSLAFSTTGNLINLTFAVSVGIHEISNTVKAYIDGSTLDVADDLEVLATNESTIEVLTIGGALGSGAFTGAGAGNSITNTTKAYIKGGGSDPGIDVGGDVYVEASDISTVAVDAGAVGLGLVFASTPGIALAGSFGASAAVNEVENVVEASVEDATIDASGKIDITATTESIIEALTIAGAGAVAISTGSSFLGLAIAGAGTGSGNSIKNKTKAYVKNGSDLESGTGDRVFVEASDTSTIKADAVAGALSFTLGTGASVAIGVTIAENTIENTTKAFVDDAVIDSGGEAVLSAISDATISALTVAVAASVTISTGDDAIAISAAGEGAQSTNTIANTTQAYVTGGGKVFSDAGSMVSVTASDTSTLTADAAGGTVALSVSPSGFSAALAISAGLSYNDIGNTVSAYVDGASEIDSDGSVTISATSNQTIDAYALAVAAAVALVNPKQGFSVALAGAGGIAKNEITSTTSAYASGGSTVTGVGDVSISATDTSVIIADVSGIAGSLSVVGASVGITETTNDIDNQIKAYVDGSDVTSTLGGVAIDATTTATATATLLTVSVSVQIGAALGLADGEAGISGQTQAYVGSGSTITARSGNVSVGASTTAAATTHSEGGAGAIGVGVSSMSANATIDMDTDAHIAEDTVIEAGSVDVTAEGTHTVDSLILTVGIGLAVAGNTGFATASIDSDVNAFVGPAGTLGSGVTQATIESGGYVNVDAKSTDDVTVLAEGGAGGGAAAKGHLYADGDIAGATHAFIGDGTHVSGLDGGQMPGDLTVKAEMLAALIDVDVLVGGGSLTVAVTGGDTGEITIDRSVYAYLADDVDVQMNATGSSGGNATISAIGRGEADAKVETYAGSILVEAHSPKSVVKLTPEIQASLGDNSVLNASGDVEVTATLSDQPPAGTTTPSDLIQGVDAASDTLDFEFDLSTGEVVTYVVPSGQSAIAGLEDGREYEVIDAGDDKISFGAQFDAVGGVDSARDTITFSAARKLRTGDAVRLDDGGSTSVIEPWQLNLPSSDPAYVDPSQVFYVRAMDQQTDSSGNPLGVTTIKLARTKTEAEADLPSFDAADVSGSTITVPGVVFAEDQAVTYRAAAVSEFSASNVDVSVLSGVLLTANGEVVPNTDADNLYLPNHGFSDGDAVVYRRQGSGPEIGELQDGETYYVIKLGENEIQLAATYENAIGDDSVSNPQPPVPIEIEVSSDAGAETVIHSLELSIDGLEDGVTYYVVNSNASTGEFQLAESPGANPLTLNTAHRDGQHSIGVEGIDLVASTDTHALLHQLVFDLGSSTVDKNDGHSLAGPGGISLDLISPPTGDGKSSSTVKGGGGGAIDVGDVRATLEDDSSVQSFLGANSVITAGGDVQLSATSQHNASTNVDNQAGGVIKVGIVRTRIDQTTDTDAYLDDSASITAEGDVSLTALTDIENDLVAYAGGGGAIGAAVSDTASRVQFDTTATVGEDASIVAGGAVKIHSDSTVDAFTDSSAFVIALGAGADADGLDDNGKNDTEFGGGIQIGVDNVAVTTDVVIGKRALVEGGTVDLDAKVSKLKAKAVADAQAYGGVTTAYADAEINIDSNSNATIASDAVIRGLQGVDIQSRHSEVDVDRKPTATAVGLIPPQEAKEKGDSDLKSIVDADAGATIYAGPRVSAFAGDTDLKDDGGFSHLALYVQANEGQVDGGGGGNRTFDIRWDADVVINSGPSPELVIDANGTIQRAVNVSVDDGAAGASRTSGTIASDDIVVNDIVNDDAGEVLFEAKDGVINGDQGEFSMLDGYEFVSIINGSDKDLILNRIDVVNTAATNSSSPPRPRIVLVSDDVNIDFDLQRDIDPSLVDVQNLGAGDLGLNGAINNPIGETFLYNSGGDIVNGADVTSFAQLISLYTGKTAGTGSVLSNELDIDSAAGSVGAGATGRIVVQLVESNARSELLKVVADQSIWLDLTGIQRVSDTDTAPTVLDLDIKFIEAGDTADVLLRSGVLETSSADIDGVYVDSPNDSSDAPDKTFYTRYSNDGTRGRRDAGAYGGTAADIEIDYDFEIIRSGGVVDTGDIIIAAANPSSPTTSRNNVVNVEAVTNVKGSGHLDIDTNGLVDATEGSGNMRVGNIISRYDDVILSSPKSIVDAASGDGAPPAGDATADVSGKNITLDATDSIGSTSNFLEINSSYSAFGVLVATSADGTFVQETAGDLNIDTVDVSAGDASIVSVAGAILDGRGGGSGDTAWNIRATSVDLDANGGGIGESTNDLEIDTRQQQQGHLYADASDDIYLEEVDGALDVLQVESFAGLVRLTVRESSDLDEDLNLLTGGVAWIEEDASVTLSRGRIAAAESVELRIGDGFVLPTAAEVLAGLVDSTAGIIVRGDHNDSDSGYGTSMVLQGEITPGDQAKTELFGNVDVDSYSFLQTLLGGVTRAFGSASAAVPSDSTVDDGEDQFLVSMLRTMDVASLHTLTLDGQADTDTYQVLTTGSRNQIRNYIINVLDSGAKDDGSDTLDVLGYDSSVNGLDEFAAEPSDDIFLLRRTSYIPGKFGNEVSESPAFVALLHGTIDQARLAGADGDEPSERPQEVQRINYDASINGRMSVYGQGGNDWFAVDDNSVISTLDGGLGNDNFQIGQIYGSLRQPSDVSQADAFPTVATTRGYISPGISAPLVAQGGQGDDSFSVYSNQAELRLEGDAGNDLFVVRAFAIALTDPVTGEILTNPDGSAQVDTTNFSTGEQTNILPGAGNDSVEYNVNAPVSIDGGSGFDKVLVLGTEFPDNFVIRDDGIYGAGITIRYENVEVVEVDGLEGDDDFFVVSTPSGVATRIIGGLGSDHVSVGGDVADRIVSRQLEGSSGTINHTTTSGDDRYDGELTPGIDLNVASEDQGVVIIQEQNGTVVREGAVDNTDTYTVKLAEPITDQNTVVFVTVSAARSVKDEEDQGGDTITLAVDRDGDGTIDPPADLFTGTGQADAYTRKIVVDGVTTYVRNRSVVLRFDSTNWDLEQTVFVQSIADGFAEGDRVTTISHSVLVSDNATDDLRDVYDGVAVRNVEVTVIDQDAPGLIITPTDGETQVVEGSLNLQQGYSKGIADSYDIQLTKAPSGSVTVQFAFDDDQVLLSSKVGSRFSTSGGIASLTFDASNWSTPVTIDVTAFDDGTPSDTGVAEDRKVSVITHSIDATVVGRDPEFDDLLSQLDVEVLDDDLPDFLVQESDGSTLVSKDGTSVVDTYTIRLTAEPTADVMIDIETDGQTITSPTQLTFTDANWWIPQTVTVYGEPSFVPVEGTEYDREFSAQKHLLSNLRGPLHIEGGSVGPRALVSAIVLPKEGNQGLLEIGDQPLETEQIDVVNIYDDSSGEDKQGELSSSRLTGLNLPPDLVFPDGTAFGEPSVFPGGINFGQVSVDADGNIQADGARSSVEVLNVMLGEGNDQLSITGTLLAADEGSSGPAKHGTLTMVHGGGNSLVGGVVGGDTITITGGGGPGSPLVVFGDTSQDGVWYSGDASITDRSDNAYFGLKLHDQVGDADDAFRYGRAVDFDYNGNDVIDASGLDISDMVSLNGQVTVGVTIYGGGGNDTIDGSEAGDHLAGGSGDDVIRGGSGPDHIYGDSGFNVDPITRSLLVITSDPSADPVAFPPRDTVLAGNDTIHGGEGSDVVFGDHGVVQQDLSPGTFYSDHLTGIRRAVINVVDPSVGSSVLTTDAQATEKLLSLLRIQELRTVEPGDGGDDHIRGGLGIDRIFGGNGTDTINGGGDADVIFGDQGQISYVGPDYFGTDDSDLGTMDLIKSIDTESAFGADDIIFDDSSDDIILGGQGDDRIDAGSGQNIVFGDHGELLGVDSGANQPVGDPDPSKVDDAYAMQTLGLLQSIAFEVDTSGGNDVITTGVGRDIIFGGQGDDTINSYASDGGQIQDDGNNIVFGDFGLVDYLAEELADATQTPRTDDIDRIASIAAATALGGHDSITTGAGNDIVLGGAGDDVLSVGEGQNLTFGDNVALAAFHRDHVAGDPPLVFSVHEFTVGRIESVGFGDADSGNDVLTGNASNDVFFGGGGDDIIYAGGGDDLVFGDHGLIEATNDHPYDPATSLPPICWDLFPGDGFVRFTALNVDQSTGSGDDLVYGQEGRDVLMGQQGNDVLDGGLGDDILIGGSNVSGALDGDDRLDGGMGNDVVAGDNAEICYRPDLLDPRMRVLQGTQIYGTTAGNDGLSLVNELVDGVPQFIDPRGGTQYHIRLIDHSDTVEASRPEWFGNDYIAGGGGDDELFGQLGHDVIQGDGKIGTDPRTDLSVIAFDGAPTTFGAFRDGTVDDESSLIISPSLELASDGDDYIEGNGGQDVLFGNLGQDDLIGGSSNLFGLENANDRPDGDDLIFGGAGIDVARNDAGDAVVGTDGAISVLPSGHALDADVILGDNGVITRLVGVNGTQVDAAATTAASGLPASGGFLNFFHDSGPVDSNPDTYDRVVARSVQFLDYTPGGVLHDSRAANDRGGDDEIHGESGDDTVYGQRGNDVLFGDGQNDDLIGGYGHDWISGGTGDDGVLGDDGRIMTSRNSTTGEPLNGVAGLLDRDPDPKNANGNVLDEYIKTPGAIQEATINVSGELKKSANLVPFSVDPAFNGQFDEFVYSGSKQNDPLEFTDEGHYSDDILYGGLGNDVLHGGSGDDAMSGAEAPTESYTQLYDATGVLVGITRSDFGHPINLGDTLRFNPEDADGWHYDSTRRAGEFALYDEYDPRRKILLDVDGTASAEDTAANWFLNFDPSEGVHRPAGTIEKATGQSSPSYSEAWDDGQDALFGDLGNDWLVGGTGRDNLYGGFGNDLLNADDDHNTDTPDVPGSFDNESPDTQPSYEDRAFGGAGRDVLIGNTGGDRLIDWVGEFNSYLVPYAPFGMASVSRTMQPQLAEFLYALSFGDGADSTRATDVGNPERNGEPEGELGLIRQQDPAWQDQTGAPTDPQAGNIPGGKRDVLRSAGFNDGQMHGMAADSGTWEVVDGRLQVSAQSNQSDAVSVLALSDALPTYFEVLASVTAEKPTAGWKANGYIIFDYQSADQFKFAGIDVSNNKLVMGHRDSQGWHVDRQASVQGGIKHGKTYNLLLAVNGLTASLLLDNQTLFTHAFEPSVQDGYSFGLNWGLIGVGSDQSQGTFDNLAVQVLPPSIVWDQADGFDDGSARLLVGPSTGNWLLIGGALTGTADNDATAIRTVDFGLQQGIQSDAYVEVSASVATEAVGGLLFDQYAEDDFKYASLDPSTQQLFLGHVTPRRGIVADQVVPVSLAPGQPSDIKLVIKGTTVSVLVNDQLVTSHVYNSALTDGSLGVFSQSGQTTFDDFRIRTDDSRLLQWDASISTDPLDVNADGEVSPIDALLVINQLATIDPSLEGESTRFASGRFDVNRDQFISASDALMIINRLGVQATDDSAVPDASPQTPLSMALQAAELDKQDDDLITLLADDQVRWG
ncbi:hypothetical protein FYK55_16405 [Roseiconus nitratireducens]|uniref:Uncharacterized protein n=1 Tax=Roseiconus nitratireducens TaxID=2605748 RepID=A0A5M6D2U6_9BACT|nr:dockerin type I domain-containing protein [Roseiconus nitratireducens]KAA5541791.1 hypothetical protein FYK55_16405 [Roseiconus nitratireducens]